MVSANRGVGVNYEKKQLGCIVDFLGLEFDTLYMEARLPEDKLKKAIKEVTKVLERRSSTTHEKLQSLVGILPFASKGCLSGPSISPTSLHWSKPIEDDLLWWEKFLL